MEKLRGNTNLVIDFQTVKVGIGPESGETKKAGDKSPAGSPDW